MKQSLLKLICNKLTDDEVKMLLLKEEIKKEEMLNVKQQLVHDYIVYNLKEDASFIDVQDLGEDLKVYYRTAEGKEDIICISKLELKDYSKQRNEIPCLVYDSRK